MLCLYSFRLLASYWCTEKLHFCGDLERGIVLVAAGNQSSTSGKPIGSCLLFAFYSPLLPVFKISLCLFVFPIGIASYVQDLCLFSLLEVL